MQRIINYFKGQQPLKLETAYISRTNDTFTIGSQQPDCRTVMIGDISVTLRTAPTFRPAIDDLCGRLETSFEKLQGYCREHVDSLAPQYCFHSPSGGRRSFCKSREHLMDVRTGIKESGGASTFMSAETEAYRQAIQAATKSSLEAIMDATLAMINLTGLAPSVASRIAEELSSQFKSGAAPVGAYDATSTRSFNSFHMALVKKYRRYLRQYLCKCPLYRRHVDLYMRLGGWPCRVNGRSSSDDFSFELKYMTHISKQFADDSEKSAAAIHEFSSKIVEKIRCVLLKESE
ncbi:hypothetical protein BOTBODRAFT_187003 [Botryobasidium botryosum FD-172 SS1]|uniref:Uncharacterized protein n=1 Tax=Botryobasidium botryosum (strain FD-172 SS1) TaxID=930990 RepID=A0A067MWQ4_BOTB1|nr:hypothetical protein BOTBODRAFT_187003 [Botryobasidium botryosum FD-172 SS1]